MTARDFSVKIAECLPKPTPAELRSLAGNTNPQILRGIDATFRQNGIVKNFERRKKPPLVGIIMGSQSDWQTMAESSRTLKEFRVPHECAVVSAHRTPDRLADYAKSARQRGLRVIIAGAGGAAHLPGMCASWTTLPVLGVPVESRVLHGVDSLLSIVQMPSGIPVGTLAVGTAGAVNAALLAVQILSLQDEELAKRLENFRKNQTGKISAIPPWGNGRKIPSFVNQVS